MLKADPAFSPAGFHPFKVIFTYLQDNATIIQIRGGTVKPMPIGNWWWKFRSMVGYAIVPRVKPGEWHQIAMVDGKLRVR